LPSDTGTRGPWRLSGSVHLAVRISSTSHLPLFGGSCHAGSTVGLLAGAIILLVIIGLLERLATLLQEFYFARFEQEVLLDIQHDLLERALRFPKAFFDQNETGYLMSRLSSDVQGLRWFFSGTIVGILSNLLRSSEG